MATVSLSPARCDSPRSVAVRVRSGSAPCVGKSLKSLRVTWGGEKKERERVLLVTVSFNCRSLSVLIGEMKNFHSITAVVDPKME